MSQRIPGSTVATEPTENHYKEDKRILQLFLKRQKLLENPRIDAGPRYEILVHDRGTHQTVPAPKLRSRAKPEKKEGQQATV